MRQFRNPRFAPEMLERRLSPSAIAPASVPAEVSSTTCPEPCPEPAPSPDGTPPIYYPPLPSGPAGPY